MKKKKNNVNNITIISIIIVLLVLCLSIGWSSLNSSIRVSSSALVRINSDIRITGFSNNTGVNGGVSINDEYNVKSASSTITLPNSNSTVTYKVEVTNIELATNTYMGINNITGLPNNLEITNITDYTLKSKICDDNDGTECSSGAQKTFYITVGYKNNAYDANNTTFDFQLEFDFKKVFDINYAGFTNPPLTPLTVMDGDTTIISFNSDAREDLTIVSGGVTLTKGVNYTYTNRVLTFLTPIRDHVFITNPTTFTITYVLNGGTQAINQVTTYSLGDNTPILSPTKAGSVFGGWYLYNDFSGNDIVNTSELSGDVTLYANWVSNIARIGNDYYVTLQAAINAVPTNNTAMTVELLGDTSEVITIAAGKNVSLDLKNNTLRNSGSNPVITNNGTLTISNGTITSSVQQGAINNNGTMYVTGGTVAATGSRQAIYNAGVLNISGGTFTSTTSQRATVQNLSTGNTTITGGTIHSTGGAALQNEGTLKIGVIGSGVNTSVPSIIGETYGVTAITSFEFYDGKISGKTDPIDDASKISQVEPGYEVIHTAENGYKESYLVTSFYTVTFVYDGGVETELTRGVEAGHAIGTLPTTSKSGYRFDGWFDDDGTGNQIDATKLINGNIRFYAHWTDLSTINVARIGTNEYTTLPAAFSAITNSTPTTIVILEDITLSGKQAIGSSRNITVDLNGHNINYSGGTVFENSGTFTIMDSTGGGSITGGKRNGNSFVPAVLNKKSSTINLNSGSIHSDVSQVFENNGTFNMSGGSISIGNVDQGILNNNAGATFNMTGGIISATIEGSKRQALYNKGTATISGTSVLISATTDRAVVQNDDKAAKITINGGTITGTSLNCDRGAVQNIAKATVIITGGTIVSKSTVPTSGAVQNAGILTIGVQGGGINASSPDLTGDTYGVNNNGTFNYYDGVLKGQMDSINGSISSKEANSNRIDTTEVIGGITYHKTYLN